MKLRNDIGVIHMYSLTAVGPGEAHKLGINPGLDFVSLVPPEAGEI